MKQPRKAAGSPDGGRFATTSRATTDMPINVDQDRDAEDRQEASTFALEVAYLQRRISLTRIGHIGMSASGYSVGYADVAARLMDPANVTDLREKLRGGATNASHLSDGAHRRTLTDARRMAAAAAPATEQDITAAARDMLVDAADSASMEGDPSDVDSAYYGARSRALIHGAALMLYPGRSDLVARAVREGGRLLQGESVETVFADVAAIGGRDISGLRPLALPERR